MLSEIQRPVGEAAVKSIWRSVIAANNAPAPLPEATTVNFTSAQFATGLAGSVSTTRDAGKVYWYASRTLWCGVITGTEAKLTATNDWGGGGLPNMLQVAVDGGSFTAVPNVGTLFTLFTGLPQAPHYVEIRCSEAMGDVVHITSSGNILQVTGQPPALNSVASWVQAGVTRAPGVYEANAAGYPQPVMPVRGGTNGSSASSLKIRGSFSKLFVYSQASPNRVGVSKNGGLPTWHEVLSEPESPARSVVIPCDGSLATYTVWNGGVAAIANGHFAVAGNTTPVASGPIQLLDQYGDSITDGVPNIGSHVETMQVAAALGKLGGTNGVSGHTIAACKSLLDRILPLKTITSDDVAILAIGRNNVGAIDATARADYNLCIDKLLAKGYGKVLCRAIIPSATGAELWTTENAALQGLVTARANPKVIWVPTVTWFPYSSPDNTHPDAVGYLTLATFAEPAYRAALGL